jgi:hypothetical protein
MKPIQITDLNRGGIADSDYMGRPNSVSELVGIDLHSEPGLVKVQQKLTKVIAANVASEFCKNYVVCSNGNNYWFSAESGKIWQDASGTWTLKYTTSSKNGQNNTLGATEYDGYIYWATQNFIHRIKVSNASSTWDTTTVELNWADLTLDQEIARKAPIVMRFDGIDDRLTIGSFALNHTDTITFSCWFYAEEDTSDTKIYEIWGTNNTASSIQVELGGDTTSVPNKNRVAIYSGSTIVAQTDSNAFVSGTWNHLVYTRNGSGTGNHKIYINGILRTLITDVGTSFANTTAARYIATRDTSSTNPFKGLLAEIRIQSIALSAQEVADTYNGKLNKVGSSLVYYPLNNSVRDFQGSNHATISGNPVYYYITDFDVPFRTVLANALSEIDTDKVFFKANSETISQIKLWVTDIGTGSITITVHDASNTLVGSAVTIANGSLAYGWNYFNMSISGLTYNAFYHLHIHASTSDVYLKSNNVNDIADSFIQFLSNGDTEFHPMRKQNLVLFIGDRNYVHQVDFDRTTGVHVFTNRALDLTYPLRVKSLGKFNTDLLIGTVVDARIAKTQIFRWNTWSTSYDVEDEIPEQGINAFIDGDNYTLVSAGEAGNIYFYNGEKLQLMRTMKGNFDAGGKVTVNPEATANFKGLALFGLSNVSGDPIKEGIYSFGSRNSDYPQILSLDFPISQRSSGNFVFTKIEIGAIMIVGNDMYVSWRDTNGATVSGIDKLDYSNKIDGAYVTTLVMDVSRVYLNNYKQFIAKYVSLPASTDIGISYSINYGAFVAMSPFTDISLLQKRAELTLQAAPLQVKFTFTVNANNAPTVTDFIVLVD